MASRCWTYPALLAAIGAEQQPDRAALRLLVRRMRLEAFPSIDDPTQRRQRVRQAINALIQNDGVAAAR